MSFVRLAGLLVVLAQPTLAQPAPGSLLPPVPHACISSPFGPRRAVGPRAALFHNGIDFPAAAGTWVHPAAPGTVAGIRRVGAEGLEVDVAHPAAAPGVLSFITRYAHLGTLAPPIAEGARRAGVDTRLGKVGRTGVTYGTHVHFELHVQGRPIDPEPFFAVPRCVGAPGNVAGQVASPPEGTTPPKTP